MEKRFHERGLECFYLRKKQFHPTQNSKRFYREEERNEKKTSGKGHAARNVSIFGKKGRFNLLENFELSIA
jgi:hypothetical protein